VDLARATRRVGVRALPTAIWAWWVYHRARRQLVRAGVDAVRLPAPPPSSGERQQVVLGVLRRVEATCLERALVLQRWHAGRRTCRILVIGVTAPSSGFRAHAWLDGDIDAAHDGMVEILRRPPPPHWLATGRQPR
jgi:hypothetical protein